MNKKSVSPVIAVVLLITITLTAAALLRTWYFGEQQESQEQTSELIEQNVKETEERIVVESYDTNGTVYLRNTGLTTIDSTALAIYEEGTPMAGYTVSSSMVYSGDVLAIWNLPLTRGNTYKITTEVGYSTMFEYTIGNVFLYPEEDNIFNNGDTTTITAVVTDNFGNRLGSGIDVTFQTTLGTFIESGNATYTDTTDASGEATATLESDASTGRAKISALAGNYTAMTSVAIEYWWDKDWTKRKKITIEENSGNDLTDYQMELSIGYDSDMQVNYEDLRFIDSGGNELDHWIESTGDPASVWVEIPTISASSTATIYLYYGNAAASSASDADATFVFFDSFEDDTPGNEPSKWTFGGCTAYFGGSGNGNANAQRHQVVANPGDADETSTPYGSNFLALGSNDASDGGDYTGEYESDPFDLPKNAKIEYWLALWDEDLSLGYDGMYMEVMNSSDTQIVGDRWDGGYFGGGSGNTSVGDEFTISSASSHPDAYIQFGIWGNETPGTEGGKMQIDFVRVRSSIYPEPTFTIENEISFS
jgi:flagellin-like protein